jgi:hypothetical protein
VLESTIDVILTKHLRQRSVRGLARNTKYFAELKREEVPLYEKADRTSTIMMTTPKAIRQIHVSSSSKGLRDDSTYWKVYHIVGEDVVDPKTIRLWGYVHEDDVET